MDPDINAAIAFACATLALWMKGMIIAWAQVAIRIRTRSLVRPEDARLLNVAPARFEDPRVARLGEVWRNELEASPATLALAAGYVLLGGDALVFSWALAAFVAARFVQGATQYGQAQPARTLAWLLGVASAAIIALLLALQIFNRV